MQVLTLPSDGAGCHRDRRRGPGSDLLFRRLSPYENRLRSSDLDGFDVAPQTMHADRPIWAQDDAEKLYVLTSGFAYSFTILPDGRRYISEFFGPGAICNWSRPRQPSYVSNILFKARSVITAISFEDLLERFAEVPHLEHAIVRNEHARALRASQRTRTLVVGQASDRVLHLLLDLADELSVTGCDHGAIPVRLTQREIADLLGLSPVHLNRTIQSLRLENRIVRTRKVYKICDAEKEKALLGYRSFTRSGDVKEDHDIALERAGTAGR